MGRAWHQANAIGPGYMLTEMNQALVDDPSFNAWVIGRTPAAAGGKQEGGTDWHSRVPCIGSIRHVNSQLAVDGGMMACCEAARLTVHG
jgi:gluconate 5-dehydrogenase